MFVFRSIKPATQFKSSVFRDQFKRAAEQVAPGIEKDFNSTVATWREKPRFKRAVKVGNAAGGALAKKTTGNAGGVSIEVSTDSDVYKFVDEGTRVRYATMSPDFQAKTKPNQIRSYRGRGGRLFVNKKRPRPGIKARNFSKLIQRKWQPLFREAMGKAMSEGARQCGHGVSRGVNVK